MKRFVLFLLLLLAGVVYAAPDSYVIVPGQGFGQFRASLGLAGLEKLIKPEEFGEGECDGQPSADIFMMTPEKRITVLLDSKKKVRAMVVHGDKSVWHTKEGITLGTSLATLAKLNEKAFHFRSFEGDHQGEVVDWGQGKLARSLPRVKITFASPMHANVYAGLNDAEKLEIEAPRVYSSSDSVAIRLNPVVETIELEL
ncbi:MAG: hypothetical protein AB2L14_32660 [Candidatus Xenobiia bacterium LiM19]